MRAIIFANGTLKDCEGARALIEAGDILIAADGGARHCAALGVKPDVIVGDLDSLTEAEIEEWKKVGVEVIRHDVRKDETDLELALLMAQERGCEEVVVMGGLGGRWDQTFANLLLPAYHEMETLKLAFWHDGLWVHIVRDELVVEGIEGRTVSLIPVGGDVKGVSTEGLEWALRDEMLVFGATRGVSNQMMGERAVVRIKEGMLLCFVFDLEE